MSKRFIKCKFLDISNSIAKLKLTFIDVATNNNKSSKAEFQKSGKVNGTEDIAAIRRVDVPVKDHTVEAILATLAILILGVGACYCIHLYRRENERTQRRQLEPEHAKHVQLKTYTKVRQRPVGIAKPDQVQGPAVYPNDGVIWKHFVEQSETWHKMYDVKIPPWVIMALYAGAPVLLGIILICCIATSNCNPIRRSSPEPCHTSQFRADQYRLIEESQSRSSTLDRR
ncbi:unnamed protein product, partial [Mesorhabditis spiculigera]